jgi:hypothetical protein
MEALHDVGASPGRHIAPTVETGSFVLFCWNAVKAA